MRVNLKTLGCRLNEAELEIWAREFQAQGWRIVRDGAEADLVVLNSCAVTQDAVRKSRQSIRRIQRENPGAKLVVSGCYATLNAEETAGTLGVDLVVGNAEKARLVEIARDKLDLAAMPEFSTDPGEVSLFSLGRQRAFIKVQDGCRYRCTFCIVTVARGEERSRSVEEVVAEINALHGQGIQEFILTGVHLGGWGSELGLRLEHLLGAVLERTAIPRLRLGSLEPWELSDEFIELLHRPRFMPHLHLPLQSGSDTVLRRMARRCKTSEFAALVEKLRRAVPDINLTTDIIIGFPGETEAEWQETLRFVEAMEFGHLHIFSYSPRAGTKAAGLPDAVSVEIKKARGRELQALARAAKRKALSRLLGRELPILWEDKGEILDTGGRRFWGYTPNYLRAETTVFDGMDLGNRIASARLEAVAGEGEYVAAKIVDRRAQ
jgi:threonylcarbamoyladenosine tRNA methylthiotransferase MtaB